jgi:hypothetical protein
MGMKEKKASTHSTRNFFLYLGAIVLGVGGLFAWASLALPALLEVTYSNTVATPSGTSTEPAVHLPPPLDTTAYNTKLLALAHVATSSPWHIAFLAGTTTVTLPGATTSIHVLPKAWPTRAPYPTDGRALLPFNRIVSYYGNFLSKGMGVLGQYPVDEMLTRLASTTAEWQAADPTTPVIPAIHYIVEVAQAGPGADGKYRARMPDAQVDKALELAQQINGIVFLDFQVGLSDLQTELPIYESYLKLPNVELGIDPEFAMQPSGAKPGHVIGTFDAKDVNFAAEYLANLVRENNLPPKILVVHRFTEDMLTNYRDIKPLPEVQVVVDMDGWGDQQKKIGTYTYVVAAEPVQFTGFKLFYKNDLLPPSTSMLTPKQVLDLTPSPVYIQYQ